jgi:hypothetical protein
MFYQDKSLVTLVPAPQLLGVDVMITLFAIFDNLGLKIGVFLKNQYKKQNFA